MFALEFKESYIISEPMRKNRTHQTFRWKQAAICEERGPLDDFISKQKKADEWRVSAMGF